MEGEIADVCRWMVLCNQQADLPFLSFFPFWIVFLSGPTKRDGLDFDAQWPIVEEDDELSVDGRQSFAQS